MYWTFVTLIQVLLTKPLLTYSSAGIIESGSIKHLTGDSSINSFDSNRFDTDKLRAIAYSTD